MVEREKPSGETFLLSALGEFFGREAKKKNILIRKLESELLVLKKLKELGFKASSLKNVGANRTPSIVLSSGLKIDVKTRNLESPTGLDDFSIKKNGAGVADAVVCHCPLSGAFYVFSRAEVKEFWLEGEYYYSPDCLYFYPWKTKEEAEGYCGKTKKGRERSWGRLFSNKDRFLDWANSIVSRGEGAFEGSWKKLKNLSPEGKEKPEKKELDVSDIAEV